MRLLIRFLDNEVLEVDSDAIDPRHQMFVTRPVSGNNKLSWISFASVKYITARADGQKKRAKDPWSPRGRPKVILRFRDGEVLRAYKDDAFGQEGHAFNARLWDPESGRLIHAVVSAYALKAVFFVTEWDSRAPEQRHYLVSPRAYR